MPSQPPPSSQPPLSSQPSDEPASAAPVLVRLTIESVAYTIDFDEVAESIDPARVLWWAELLGRAERERLTVEATLRQARATKTRSVAMAHPKRAEWRVRSEVDADTALLEHRLALAECERAVSTLRHLVELLIRLV